MSVPGMETFADVLGTGIAGAPGWAWLVFAAVTTALLVLDLGVLHRRPREIGVAESLWLSAFYIGAALAFALWVWTSMGEAAGITWLTGFVVEKTLALDNVFVISLIFSGLAIPRQYQHKVLVWGIIGVIVLRALAIGLGTAVVAELHFVLLLFAVFLLVTGARMLIVPKAPPSGVADNAMLRLLRRHLNVTDRLHEGRFWVRLPPATPGGRTRLFATPLLLALLAVEFADLVFAIDSLPAILAITTDPFIAFTSNVFAILGLRALYFALAALVHRLPYLKQSLALILMFIGAKIIWAEVVAPVHPGVALLVTVTLLALGIAASLLRPKRWVTG
jgi:tellurite resistance protein TerC